MTSFRRRIRHVQRTLCKRRPPYFECLLGTYRGGATEGYGGHCPPTHERWEGQGVHEKENIILKYYCHLMHEPVVINSCWSMKFETNENDMRAMFPLVESLIRLLLVNPASSATAERSFSSLRRLKTYLRSTCGQRRLNDLALCHIHKDVVDKVNIHEVMKEFILARDSRVIVFGHITTWQWQSISNFC